MINFSATLLIPELYMVVILVVLFAQSLSKRWREHTGWVGLAGLGGIVATLLSMGHGGSMFFDSYQVDRLSQFFKIAVFLGLTVCSFNARRIDSLGATNRADYFFFMGTSALGLILLASTVELFTMYIALELASYSVYILLPMRNAERGAVEGAIKYALFGAVATAIGLLGISFIIAGHHTTYLGQMSGAAWSLAEQPMALIGLFLFVLAFVYKLALFPFHFWCPDVYQGASNETAAFAATMPKIGAVIILVRLMALIPGEELRTVLAVLAALSMTIGNLAALNQTDIKRMLGYSSVSHAGYLIMGLTAGGTNGLAATSYYILVYVVMNLALFWVITSIARNGENVTLSDLRGLHASSPALAFVLAVAAFALVGLPPTGGFTGKLFLLSSAWSSELYWLVLVAAANTAIAIFYYLNLVRHAYAMDQEQLTDFRVSRLGSTAALMLALAVLYLGLRPQGIYDFLITASGSIM